MCHELARECVCVFGVCIIIYMARLYIALVGQRHADDARPRSYLTHETRAIYFYIKFVYKKKEARKYNCAGSKFCYCYNYL